MTEEPRWPTVESILAASGPLRREVAAEAIELCRAAWLASVDDPAQSPAGEVRTSPIGTPYIRQEDGTGGAPWLTFLAAVHDSRYWLNHADVKGWPVIGSVPGSPAAEAKP